VCEGKVLFCCVFIEVLLVMWNSMVINGVWSCKRIGGVCGLSCSAIRFGFHVFFFSMQDMSIWFLFQGFKVFFVCYVFSCCEKWMLWPINDVQAFMKAWFHKLGTRIKTFSLRICEGLLHYDKKVMYNLFMNYTHTRVRTFAQERNMSASWNSKYRVWHSIYTFYFIFLSYLRF
jgi:hypothetical protein